MPIQQAMRDLMGIRNRNYFEDDLDAFEEFIGERLQDTTYGSAQRVPARRQDLLGGGVHRLHPVIISRSLALFVFAIRRCFS